MSTSNRAPLARLIVLGIDAASPDLLERWIADGSLPNLAALVRRGTVSLLRGVEGFFVGSTWPSMYTGTNPAEHSVHYLLEMVRGTYELRESVKGAFVRRPAFWRALSDAGKRVAILDVPLTRLEEELNGVQVVEWGGHDSIFGFRAFPAALEAEILERFGTHPVGSSCDAENRTSADYADFAKRLEQGAARKGELSRHILAGGGWDLFMQVFTEAHCAGHQCWHLHDATHPAHDPASVALAGNPMHRAYVAIDREIGAIVAMEPNAQVVVFSAHSMSHWYGAQFLLHDVLVKLGASVAKPAPAVSTSAKLKSTLRVVWRQLPQSVRSAIKRVRNNVVPPNHIAARPAFAADVLRSRCFVHPNGLAVGGIRLNLVGREPSGLLESGKAADEFVEWLSAALLELVDERTGLPLVKRVTRTSTLYQGENIDLLPDLLVEWSDATATGSTNIAGGIHARIRATSPRIGVVEGANEFARTGEHRPSGWMVAAGPGITTGTLANAPALFDLAPTLSAMLGVQHRNASGQTIGQLVNPMP
ncbi:MAG: alkaline phosphatase family protein [Phycisphaerae bacterium]|nr:alkaline phosphatase family protein [Gemmatimonadaceae bacterium]